MGASNVGENRGLSKSHAGMYNREGNRMQNDGLYSAAGKAFLRAGNIERAIKNMVMASENAEALRLARQHGPEMLKSYALACEATRPDEALELLVELGKKEQALALCERRYDYEAAADLAEQWGMEGKAAEYRDLAEIIKTSTARKAPINGLSQNGLRRV